MTVNIGLAFTNILDSEELTPPLIKSKTLAHLRVS